MENLRSLKVFCEGMGCRALEQEPMSKHITMRVGGPAQLFLEPSNIEQIGKILAFCHQRQIPVAVIGNGSNLLVSDNGVQGVVLCMGSAFSHVEPRDGHRLYATAGTSLSTLCSQALSFGLTGLEFAWGIPASVGGAVYMNAGAYGGEMKDVLEKVWHFTPQGQLVEADAHQLGLDYRHSDYMTNGCCIVAAQFRLSPGDPAAIRQQMDDLMARRKEKQPLEYPSSGSTFKRPQGAYAAQLIDQCGLKGRQVGGAAVSEKHAGFIINRDHATCADLEELIAQVQQVVFEKTGYRLECEVKKL